MAKHWMKKYRVGFDIWGLAIFLIVMIPNFIWFAIPAPHDVLRAESKTPAIDGIASICQILFVAALCVLIPKGRKKLKVSPSIIVVIGCILLYFIAWIFYYSNFVNPLVILLLTVPPCLAFLAFTINRKNYIAAIPALIFSICHVIYGVVNFIW